MVSSNAETIELYLAELPPAWRAVVERLARRIARTALERESSMRYRTPTFDLDGLPWIAIAVQKHGLSFYFVDLDLLEDRRGELEACSVGKSCVRVRKPEDVPFAVLDLEDSSFDSRASDATASITLVSRDTRSPNCLNSAICSLVSDPKTFC